MKIVDVENPRKIIQNKKQLEEALKVKITIKRRKLELSGKEIDEYSACKIFEAINYSFSINSALLLCNEDYILEKINIKDLSRKNPKEIRARIIGTHGKTLRSLCKLSDCDFVLKDNTVYIIGNSVNIKTALNALKSLIHGSRQANVYKYLEKARKRRFAKDLGLREEKTQ